MRVLSTQEAGGFVPITVALSIESRDELNALYQLANYGTIVAEAIDANSSVGGEKPHLVTFLESLYEQLSAYHSRHC